MLPRSDVEAEFIETRSDGAVFRFGADLSGAATAAEVREIGRSALDVVQTYCENVLDGIEKPLPDWDGFGAFETWPCESEQMIYKFSNLGGDWNQMAVIISDRHLATCFRQEFCRVQPSSARTSA